MSPRRNDATDPSRRLFLRGAGVALALPWLESLPAFGETAADPATAGQAGASPPLRLGIVFFSNGVEPAHWWAKGRGAEPRGQGVPGWRRTVRGLGPCSAVPPAHPSTVASTRPLSVRSS
jgi:hypothetical protein